MGHASKARRRERELQTVLSGEVVLAQRSVITFEGESFIVADRLGLMPLLRFAHLAKKGVDSDDMDGLVAIYDLLYSVIADTEPDENGQTEWTRFQDLATEKRATGDDLMGVVSEAIELITSNPSARPSVSSDGPPTTSHGSSDDTSSRVIRRLVKEGRPSIALMVQRTQEQGSRASA
jgi:hypothetical protein